MNNGLAHLRINRHAATICALALLVAISTACNAQDNSNRKRRGGNATNNPPAKVTVQQSPVNREVRAPISFAPVIKKVTPSVVNIYSTTTIRERAPMDPLLQDPFFRRFFGGDPEQLQPRERQAQGLGSGVIVSADGYILTANHVVEGADEVKVALPTGDKEYDARVIGNDPLTDIAVLKIDPKQTLPAAIIGDSENLMVGDLILAIGNPFGVGQTVTMGIVSGLSRGGFGITAYENFIQTDAAINPGNSGGALVDAEGRLVGINTAILSRSGGFQGVGLAVPINMARGVMDQLIKSGKVSRGYLGVSIQPLTGDLAKEFGLPEDNGGVLVGGIMPKGSAAQAGVREGDIIIELNGKKVADPRSLQLIVSQTAPNSKVEIKVLRTEGNSRKAVPRTLTATLAELPGNAFGMTDQRPEDRPGEASQMDALDGVEVADLDSRVRRQFNIPSNIRGALVTNVDPGSNAGDAGLRPGDVIVEINRQGVHNAEEAVELSDKANTDRILLRVWNSRGGGTRYLVVDNTKH